jgi:hypothetical protein
MIVCHPCRIGRITLLDWLLVNDDRDLLVRLLLFTCEKVIELCGTHSGSFSLIGTARMERMVVDDEEDDAAA